MTDTMTLPEAAAYLGISVRGVRAAVTRGHLERVGGGRGSRVLLSADSVRAYRTHHPRNAGGRPFGSTVSVRKQKREVWLYPWHWDFLQEVGNGKPSEGARKTIDLVTENDPYTIERKRHYHTTYKEQTA